MPDKRGFARRSGDPVFRGACTELGDADYWFPAYAGMTMVVGGTLCLHEAQTLPHAIVLKYAAAIARVMSGRTHIMNSDKPRAGEGVNWLFGIIETLLVLAALAFALIAAFLAPAHHETLSTLASARQTDLAIAVGLAMVSLAAAIAAELLRRRLQQTKGSLPPRR